MRDLDGLPEDDALRIATELQQVHIEAVVGREKRGGRENEFLWREVGTGIANLENESHEALPLSSLLLWCIVAVAGVDHGHAEYKVL